MPWSPSAHRLFEAAARNPAIAKAHGIPQGQAAKMASEGIKHDPKKLGEALKRRWGAAIVPRETHGAPASLAHEARRRELSVDQQERIAHCDTVENNVRHLMKFIETGGDFDAAWLTIARTHLQIGMMCARRAVTRQDFFWCAAAWVAFPNSKRLEIVAWPKGKPRGKRVPGSGRKTGTPNKEVKPLREMILQALNEQPGGGVGYLRLQATTNAGAFISLLGRVLPMAVTGADGEGPVVIEIVKFGEK